MGRKTKLKNPHGCLVRFKRIEFKSCRSVTTETIEG